MPRLPRKVPRRQNTTKPAQARHQEGRRRRRTRSPGYRIKNKNPTQSCGELTATWLSLAVKCVKKMTHFKCTALPHRHVCNNMFSPRFSHSPGSRLCLCMHAKTARVHLLAIQPANKIHPASQRKKEDSVQMTCAHLRLFLQVYICMLQVTLPFYASAALLPCCD